MKEISRELYRQVRCGLLHQGLTRGKVAITRGASQPMVVSTDAGGVQQVLIDPWSFLSHVETHFANYVCDLRNPANLNLRVAFESWFDGRAA